MKKTIRYLLIFNPVSMILFCLLPTIETRRGLILYKFKEVISMKLISLKNLVASLTTTEDPHCIRKFPAYYLGYQKISVPMSEQEKRFLEMSEKATRVHCLSPDGQEVSFHCIICDDTNTGIIVRLWCFAPKKLKIISNPNNIWFFSFY